MNYGYGASCSAPALSGHFFEGLGAALTPAQRQAKQAAAKQARLTKQAATKVAAANRKAAAKAKRAAKVAGKTVQTSNPQAASKIDAAVKAAQAQLSNVISLAARAKQTRNKADVQKALVAATSAGKTIQTLTAPVAKVPTKSVALRGMGYMGDCIDDSTGAGTYIDTNTGAPCDPSQAGGAYVDPTTGLPLQTGYPSTGLSPGFGIPSLPQLPTLNAGNYAPLRACNAGSNLPRCIIYQMAQDEQSQFQYVFSILQQMYAQLLQIVQQLMAQLQSAQQQPYGAAYGASPYTDPYAAGNPYAASPYGSPYGDPYAGQYGGQYASPQSGYYGGGDASAIPAGFDDGSGDMSAGVPGDASQVFPGPGNSGAGYPMMQSGGPPPGLISSDSLPDGADQQGGNDYGSGDDAAGLIPTMQSGPNLAPQSNAPVVATSVNAPTTAQPQIIVLQQGPGQNPYSDSALPAGNKQNQPELDPPEHDDLTSGY